MSTNYGISDGHGNQITVGLQDHNVWRVAQRIADERGESVYVWEDGGAGDEESESLGEREVKPSEIDEEDIAVSEARPTDTGVDSGLDVNVTLTIGDLEVEGEVTLAPHSDPREKGRYVAYGDSPETWVTDSILRHLRKRDDWRAVLNLIEAAAAAKCAEYEA